ncbi:glycosyltransferase [Amphiplicatus metriothermophilus]|uniref:Glycosyltransferase involved in cell wall bisynthesis n=1 Tax=Amphiplicatus metriothermophilus TaxID=1519374 RepID=A0A239PPH2_9PROT|nr:glycosyltransferase [Amphiplicatus metriothermophilus]MBB5518894.1 glycosyltransferase involved in cell wall biosynthesis [Amphiplicatus metriothermophilus]SNT71953.1 Glycosyltransferase involved in cell wall bisynthesis [Amphiplicatus metriothermophilus]
MNCSALRIIHVFPTFAIGGQQMRLASLARGLGSDFRHVVVGLDGDLGALAAFDGVEIEAKTFALRKGRGLFPENIVRLRRLLGDSGADLLCTYNFGAIEAAIANRFGPRLAHVHHEDGFGPDEAFGRQKRRRVWLRRLALRRATTAVASLGLEQAALEVWRLPRARVKRAPAGVDVKRFAAASRARRAGSPVVIGAVGALRREKNFARLIEAFSAIGGEADARLVIHGEGPERARLEALIRGRGLAGRAFLPGATPAPEDAYAAMDVFALSSDTEQTPLSVMEAMAAGLPVMATDAGDIREMVSEENRPYILPLHDGEAYKAALMTLIRDETLRRNIGAANARRARARFPVEAMVDGFRKIYLDAVVEARR